MDLKKPQLSSALLIGIACILSILSGLSAALVIPLIFHMLSLGKEDGLTNQVLHNVLPDNYLLVAFIIIIFVIFISKTVSFFIFSKLSVTVFNKQVFRIMEKICNLEYTKAKSTTSEIRSLISQNFERFTNGMNSAPILVSSSFMTVTYFSFIWLLNYNLFIFLVLLLLVGVFLYYVGIRFVSSLLRDHYSMSAKTFDRISNYLGSLTENRHSEKRRTFSINDVNLAAIKSGQSKVRVDAALSLNNLISDILVIIVLFLCSYAAVTADYFDTDAYKESIVLFIASISPISMIIHNASIFTSGLVCYRSLENTIGSIGWERPQRLKFDRLSSGRIISFSKVEKKFKDFSLGPLDMDIEASCVTFLTGANGSGKSTLIRILSLDDLCYEGEAIVDPRFLGNSLIKVRENVGCVFSDYMVPLSLSYEMIDFYEFKHWCESFGVMRKISKKAGSIDISNELSDGQRTRIALAIEMATDRSLYFFDEITSDQDPYYREYIFNTVLPYLRSRGKSVVMITHDNRFFHLCDRIYKVDCGTLVKRIDPAMLTGSTESQ